jgi:hypothetical protein
MVRFRATIGRQGPNAYVGVPERVSRALARHAVAGRIYNCDALPSRATDSACMLSYSDVNGVLRFSN